MSLDYQDIGSPEVKVIEECSELIQILCKVERFGWFSSHPDSPEKNNLDDVLNEIEDVNEALNNLMEYLDEIVEEEENN